MTTRIKFRRDTAANWTAENPTLALGEPGFEQDTNRLKIGDGETAWTGLDYASGSSDSLTSDHNIAITVGNTEYFAIVNRANNDDNGVEGTAVAYDSDNNIVTLHVSEIYNNDTDSYDDILIISKFDDTGALAWQKQIDQDVDNEQTHDLVIDSDDNIIVAVSVDNDGPDSIGLIKFNSSGTIIWQKDYLTDGQYSWLELGGIVLSGTDIFVTSEYIEDDDVGTGTIGMIMKVSATDGTLDWATTLDFGFGTEPWGVDVTTGGDPVIVGRASSPSTNAAMVVRLDGTDGSEVWSKVLFAPEQGIDYASGDIVIDSQNNIFVSVNSNQDIVHDEGNNTTVTIAHVMKLNSAGVTQWIRRIGPGPCASVATGIDCDSTGNVYLAALTVAQDNPTRENNDFFSTARNVLAIAKYSTAGAVLWQRYIETDGYEFAESREQTDFDGNYPSNFGHANNRGRNMSVGLDGKLAIQVTVKQIDADDTWDNTRYWESITFQIDQDGREMTVGSGNEKFTVKASRIPGRFITIPDILGTGNVALSSLTSNVTVTTGNLTLSDGELAQQVAKSAPYAYVFGNDGTLTIPNDGDVRLTQTQIGWFSVFGPANNSFDDVWIRANCVDTATGDVYVVGQDDTTNDGFVVRYNSAGEILWSVRLIDDDNGNNTRCNAVKIHPTTGHVVVLSEYYGNENGALLLQIDPDTARVVTSTGFRDAGEDNGVDACDLDFLSDGKIVVVGRKYDEYQSYSVTANTAVSTTGLLVFNRSDIPGKTITNSGWYVGGTGITGNRVVVDTVNLYTGLTGTVRQGTGATFTIDGDGAGNYLINTINNGGTNYVPGHKILFDGVAVGGESGTHDLIIQVDTVDAGSIQTASVVSGTNTHGAYTLANGISGTNYNTGSGLVFDFYGDAANVYTEHAFSITNAGNNYVTGDTVVIPGTQLGGNTPANDLTATVSASGGAVTTFNTFAGNAQTTTWHIRTTAQTPNFGNVGTWTVQESLGGEAFVFVGTAANVEFAPVWTRVLSAGGANDTERYFSVAVDASDNVYAAGEMIARNNAAGADINNDWCAVVSKFNSAGTHQWTRALNIDIDNASYAKSVAVRGNVVVVSHESSGNGTTVITKLDGTGAVQWQRQTASGDDSSVAIDTNGDIYAVAEALMESQYNNCIKVIRFNTSGEVVWRKILATHVGDNGAALDDYFKNGRNLTLDADHLYVSGYTTAFDNNYENGFLVKLPKSGDCDGIYGGWTVMTDAYDVDKVNSTEATAFSPNGNTGEFEVWEPAFITDWWDPSDGDSVYHTFEEIRDRDGGAIEFADGTRQTSSAQQIPQKKITNGADHRLSLEDMGRHIYVTDSDTRISVPYHQDNPLPMGYTVVIINNSGGTISIDGDGGGLDIKVPGVDTAQYWDLDSPGMATLIKVEENTWFMTGQVTVD